MLDDGAAVEPQREKPRRGRVDEAKARARPGRDRDRPVRRLTVDEQQVALAPHHHPAHVDAIVDGARRRVDEDVVEHQHVLAGRVEAGLGRIPDDDGAIEALVDLDVGANVRVVPEKSGVWHYEPIVEPPSRVGSAESAGRRRPCRSGPAGRASGSCVGSASSFVK